MDMTKTKIYKYARRLSEGEIYQQLDLYGAEVKDGDKLKKYISQRARTLVWMWIMIAIVVVLILGSGLILR